MGDQRAEQRRASVPPGWAERIEGLARGDHAPPEPRLSATVVLLREHAAGPGPEAYLLRRRASMAFAGGMYAYPGGGVDPRDGAADPLDAAAPLDAADVGWAGPSPQEWSRRLGCPPATARAVVCAAVRETFEESGVLLAGVDADSVVADVSGEEWRAARAALEAHELSFAEFLAARGLVLRSDLLGAWARWITPEFEVRRYDTWFFVAVLPEGQRTAEVPGEADRVAWLTPAEAVLRAESGEFLMLAPTISTLRELRAYADPAGALAAAAERSVQPILAQVATGEDGTLTIGWPGYPELTMTGPPGRAVPATEPVPAAEPGPADGDVRAAEPGPADGDVRAAEPGPADGDVRAAEPVPADGDVRAASRSRGSHGLPEASR
jgi:8-oxo-dGTP pyrophosphatase MutT (NUDIX family)